MGREKPGQHAVLLLPMLLVACGERGDEIREPPSDLEQALQGEATHQLETLGRTGVEDPIGVVFDAAIDGEDRVHVVDASGDRGHVVDTLGDRQGTWGRAGEGPGEFQFLYSVSTLGGDTLVAYDRGLGRVTFLDAADGEALETLSLGQSGGGRPTQVRPLSSDQVMAKHLPAGFVAEEGPERDRGFGYIDVLDRSGEVLHDSVIAFPPETAHTWGDGGGAGGFMANHFGSRPLLDVGAGGVIHRVSTDSVAVSTYNVDGDRTAFFHVEVDPVPVDEELVERWIAEEPPFERVEGLEEEFRAEAETAPVVTGFAADGDGRLWLGVRGEGIPHGRWIAVSQEGEPLATVDLPEGQAIMAARGDLLVTAPQFARLIVDVPIVQIHRLEGAAN